MWATPRYDQGVFQAISSALSGTGYEPDFVIVHWYPSGDTAQVLAVQSGIPAQVAQIRSDLNNCYTLNKDAIHILVTESGPPVQRRHCPVSLRRRRVPHLV